jgi:hypothetical protein
VAPVVDLDPATGRARLSYRRAAAVFTATTAWTLHQLRHSALTHAAGDGDSLVMLLARSRHTSVRSLEQTRDALVAADGLLRAQAHPWCHTRVPISPYACTPTWNDPELLVASRCVELLQAELDCIRWPGVSADFGPGGVS